MAEIYRRDEPKKKKKKKDSNANSSNLRAFKGWIKKKMQDNQRENERKYQIPGADKKLGIKRDKEGYIIKNAKISISRDTKPQKLRLKKKKLRLKTK